MFRDSGQAEGLGFNLCVAPADSLGPSIWSKQWRSQREKVVDNLSQYQN